MVGDSSDVERRATDEQAAENALAPRLTVTSLLWIWKGGDAAGRWYFITVPDEQSGAIKAHAFGSPRGFGAVKVEARIGDIVWRTSVFPLNSGGYLLPVKKEVRCRAGIGAGDEVTVGLTLL